ncbi:MAG: restriction endonuclease subunit S [Candidatus Competibacter denitrificans]
MKAGWQQTTLGSVSQVGAGNSAPQGTALFADGIYPFFRTSDAGRIRFGDITESADYLNEDGIKGLHRFPAGTILFPKSGASTFLNHRVMLGVDGYVSSHLATIVGDEAKVDRRFLLYFLSTISAQDLIQDHAYPSLNLPLIAGIPVALPPLPEQHRIVAILDEAFDGIATAKANAEKNLQNARALFESHLQSVFTERGEGWVETRLVEVSREFGRGKSKYRPRNEPKLYGGPYPFIQTGDISNANHWLTEYAQTYSEFGLSQSRLWPKGTVCIAIVGATVGETAILDFEACFPDSVIGIVVNDQLADNEYVEFLLQSFKALLKEKGKGTARDNINLGTFENQTFPFPSLKKQEEVAATFNALAAETQRLQSLYQQKLTALDDLKKSLLHQAFSGVL